MKKMYKLGLSLGATASIVAPLTTIACDEKQPRKTTDHPATPGGDNGGTSNLTFSQKVLDIANQIVAKHPNVSNDDSLKLLIKAMIAFKPASTITDEAKLASNLTGGNQTFDGDDDLKRANLDYNDDVRQLTKDKTDQYNLLSGKTDIYTLQWYEGQDEIATISAALKEKNSEQQAISLSRKTVSDDLAVRYPVIAETDFKSAYGDFVKKLLVKIIADLGGLADMLDMAGINTWYYGSIKFLFDNFYDSNNSVDTIPADFDDKLENINKTGDVNWMAVKGMYLGYDNSFIDSYPDLMNDNWVNNKNTVGLGLMDNSQSSMKVLTNALGTSWAHTAVNGQFYFNPTLSRDDNYKANNKATPTTGTNTISSDSEFVTTDTPYSVESLMKEANKIGWNKTDKFAVWKNGLLCESNSQLINLIIHLAKEYGYTPAADEFVITDDMIK